MKQSFLFRTLIGATYILTTMFIIYVGMMLGSDALKDMRAGQVINKGAGTVPFTVLKDPSVSYVGVMDALCTDCGGARSYWLTGYSHMTVWHTEDGYFLHCVSYSQSSTPWSDDVRFFGSDYMPLTVDMDMTDGELAHSLYKQAMGAPTALGRCKLKETWENEGKDLTRRLLRAVRDDSRLSGALSSTMERLGLGKP